MNLPGRQAQRLHVEDPFLPRNLNCVLSTDKEELRGGRVLGSSGAEGPQTFRFSLRAFEFGGDGASAWGRDCSQNLKALDSQD